MHNIFGRLSASRRFIAIIAASALLVFALYACSGAKPAKRPIIGLMTTLPLQWQEGDIGDVIGAKGAASPTFSRINARFETRPIDNLSPQSLSGISALMLAQSRALSPTELNDLDHWVRGGGKLLLFADPALHWESIYPLGDKRRPMFTTLLSPLFAHWGLELVLPIAQGDEKYQTFLINGKTIQTVTAGAWQIITGGKAECAIAKVSIVANCNIGEGSAILVADADLLDADLWQGTGIRAVFGTDDFANIAWTVAQLDALTAK